MHEQFHDTNALTEDVEKLRDILFVQPNHPIRIGSLAWQQFPLYRHFAGPWVQPLAAIVPNTDYTDYAVLASHLASISADNPSDVHILAFSSKEAQTIINIEGNNPYRQGEERMKRLAAIARRARGVYLALTVNDNRELIEIPDDQSASSYIGRHAFPDYLDPSAIPTQYPAVTPPSQPSGKADRTGMGKRGSKRIRSIIGLGNNRQSQ